MPKQLTLAVIVTAAALATGCRQDMHDQPRYRPLAASTFFPDGRSARPAVEGAVARGYLKNDIPLYYGKVARDSKEFVTDIPVKVDKALLTRGQDRFNIFCAPCHDQSGAGKGTVVQRGFPPPIDLNGERVRTAPDGYLFDVITHGVRNMPGYAVQVPPLDRWAIVAWVRVLNRSQNAQLTDVPEGERGRILPEGSVK